MSKHKVGDKVRRVASGDLYEITYVTPNGRYVAQLTEGSHEVLLSEDAIEFYWEKVGTFFQVGKTYKFGSADSTYKIEELYHNENPLEGFELEALALVTRLSGETCRLLLIASHFDQMKEVQ